MTDPKVRVNTKMIGLKVFERECGIFSQKNKSFDIQFSDKITQRLLYFFTIFLVTSKIISSFQCLVKQRVYVSLFFT